MDRQTVYREIEREYERIRSDNEKREARRREAVYARLPAVKEIDGKTAALGAELVRNAIRHANPSESEKIRKQLEQLSAKKTAALESIGLNKGYLEKIYTCPLCRDTGYINSEKCGCMKKKLIEKYYVMSNLSSVLEVENFAKFRADFYSDRPFEGEKLTPRENIEGIAANVKACIRDIKKDGCFNHYFFGRSGLGKTFMCSCIAKEMLDMGYIVVYMTAYGLGEVFEKRRFSRDDREDAEDAAEMLFEADLVIIDDLGTEPVSSVSVGEFFNLVNLRLAEKKSTVISSNLSLKELSLRYSDRVLSRVMGNYNIHHFYGGDLRSK